MNEAALITCTVCGTAFDPAQHASCSSCPLNTGCRMACCPSCGTTNINPAESTLVRLFSKLFGGTDHGDAIHRNLARK